MGYRERVSRWGAWVLECDACVLSKPRWSVVRERNHRTGAHEDASDRPECSNLQRDLNNIGVRSFILTGAPINRTPYKFGLVPPKLDSAPPMAGLERYLSSRRRGFNG